MADPHNHRQSADPLQMTVAEKLACEWEARHDVAARGRLGQAAPIQHYLEHARCEDHRHPRPAAHDVAASSRAPRAHTEPLGVGAWLRSLTR